MVKVLFLIIRMLKEHVDVERVFDVIKEVSGDHWTIGSFERQQFYKESKNTYAFITTSERRPFCNFILTKGVIKPDGTVWILDK